MNIPVINNESDYRAALARLDELMAKPLVPNTPEGNEFRALSLLISDWENHAYPIKDSHDPIDVILFWMEQNNLEPKDMIPYFGSQPRVSEVLNRKRKLSIAMISRLHSELNIPLQLLIPKTPQPKHTELNQA